MSTAPLKPLELEPMNTNLIEIYSALQKPWLPRITGTQQVALNLIASWKMGFVGGEGYLYGRDNIKGKSYELGYAAYRICDLSKTEDDIAICRDRALTRTYQCCKTNFDLVQKAVAVFADYVDGAADSCTISSEEETEYNLARTIIGQWTRATEPFQELALRHPQVIRQLFTLKEGEEPLFFSAEANKCKLAFKIIQLEQLVDDPKQLPLLELCKLSKHKVKSGNKSLRSIELQDSEKGRLTDWFSKMHTTTSIPPGAVYRILRDGLLAVAHFTNPEAEGKGRQELMQSLASISWKKLHDLEDSMKDVTKRLFTTQELSFNDWRSELKRGKVIDCNGRRINLGKQITTEKGSKTESDELLVFEVDEDTVAWIPENAFRLDALASDLRNPHNTVPEISPIVIYEIDEAGRIALVKRIKVPVQGMIKTSTEKFSPQEEEFLKGFVIVFNRWLNTTEPVMPSVLDIRYYGLAPKENPHAEGNNSVDVPEGEGKEIAAQSKKMLFFVTKPIKRVPAVYDMVLQFAFDIAQGNWHFFHRIVALSELGNSQNRFIKNMRDFYHEVAKAILLDQPLNLSVLIAKHKLFDDQPIIVETVKTLKEELQQLKAECVKEFSEIGISQKEVVEGLLQAYQSLGLTTKVWKERLIEMLRKNVSKGAKE